MKRILLLVSVAALMSVMLVLGGVQAAFAANSDSVCPGRSWIITNSVFSPSDDKNGNGFICENHVGKSTKYKDDHL